MFVFLERSLRFLLLGLLVLPVLVVCVLFRLRAGPRVLRWYFESMGAAFIKLGQFLATRYDILPQRYCEELARLLDHVSPVSFRRIKRQIENNLGKPLAECFASFEEKELASASVAQVHGAIIQRVIDDQEVDIKVVVKVLRPGVERRFSIDFFYFERLAWLFDRVAILPHVSFQDLLYELRVLSEEELDLRREARHLDEARRLMATDTIDHTAPEVFPEYSGAKVITMERIEGVTVAQMIEAIEGKRTDLLEKWRQEGITPRRTAKLILRSLLEQTYHHKVFHVDPHPGNLIMKGSTLVWIDFGMIGWLDERIWAQQFRLREAMSSGKIHASYQALIATLEPLPAGRDLSRFEAQLKGYMRDWMVASRTKGATLIEKSSGYFLYRAFDAIRRAGLSLPSGVMRLYRSMIIGDMTMLRIDPEIDWLSEIGEFVREESQRQVRQLAVESFSPNNVSSMLKAYASIPGALGELLDWVQNRLPELGRAYSDQLSRIERALSRGIFYTWMASSVLFWVLLGSRLFAPGRYPGWESIYVWLGEPLWWVSVVVSGLTAFILWSINGIFRKM